MRERLYIYVVDSFGQGSLLEATFPRDSSRARVNVVIDTTAAGATVTEVCHTRRQGLGLPRDTRNARVGGPEHRNGPKDVDRNGGPLTMLLTQYFVFC